MKQSTPVKHMLNSILNNQFLRNYRIAKNFREFRSFVAIRESFLCEIWGVASFGVAKASNPWKFSSQRSYFHQFAKVFSLESLPLYGNGSAPQYSLPPSPQQVSVRLIWPVESRLLDQVLKWTFLPAHVYNTCNVHVVQHLYICFQFQSTSWYNGLHNLCCNLN